MSLILEALKKSERQRRLGESPSLGSPIMTVSRRRSLLPVFIVLILLGLITLWWARRESEAPVAIPQAPKLTATPPAPVVAGPSTFNDAAQPPPSPSASAQREVVQSSAASRLPRSKAPAGATGGLTPDARAMTKPGQPSSTDESAQVATATGAADALEEQKAAAAAMATAEAQASARAGKSEGSAGNKPVPTPPVTAAPAASAPATAAGPGIKLIWELPYATRHDLPEIKLTMHVYADQPAQRFVIINGTRQVEGDEIDSLKLVEIRRDGVVFDYEGVQFLYPRGGR